MEGNFANQYKSIVVHNLGTGVRWIGVIVVFFAKVLELFYTENIIVVYFSAFWTLL